VAVYGQWKDKLGRHYEKLIVVMVLLGLLGSLLYLSVTGVRRRQIQQAYQLDLSRMHPAHPVSAELDGEPYQRLLSLVRDPYRMIDMTNTVAGFIIPEARVWCVDCRRPIPIDAQICVFCNAAQPAGFDPEAALVGGIPMSWYRQYGIDPYAPNVADMDWDGDGFTNRQEFEAGTSPIDPDDHPPVDVLLRLQSVEGRTVTLQFMGQSRMPDDSYRCQFNLPTGRTRMLSIGDTLTLGGYTFTFLKHEIRQALRRVPGYREPRLVDVPFVILESGDQEIELEYQVDQNFTEYLVTLRLALDDTTYTVRPGHTFNLRGVDYLLIRVDSRQQSVVLRSATDGRELVVSRDEAQVIRNDSDDGA
jgi:hypothetical protein